MINKDVTLVTHCTVDQMYHLMEMSDRWDGPMSGKVPYFSQKIFKNFETNFGNEAAIRNKTRFMLEHLSWHTRAMKLQNM